MFVTTQPLVYRTEARYVLDMLYDKLRREEQLGFVDRLIETYGAAGELIYRITTTSRNHLWRRTTTSLGRNRQ